MTITPVFNGTCYLCHTPFTVTGESGKMTGYHRRDGEWLHYAQEAALEVAGCSYDTCPRCMSTHHKDASLEADFQATQDLR